MYLTWCLLACVAMCRFNAALCLVHNLKISSDDRDVFKIETFGFVSGGVMNITVKDFSLQFAALTTVAKDSSNVAISTPNKMGFVMRKAASESVAQQDLETIIEGKKCIIDLLVSDDLFLDLGSESKWKASRGAVGVSTGKVVGPSGQGLYSLIFARCTPSGAHKVTFDLHAELINPGPSYLSAGDAPLAKVYIAYFSLFAAALVVWSRITLCSDQRSSRTVHRIHHMMLLLAFLKCCTLLVEAIRYHYIDINGQAEGWSIVYYVFAFLKGMLLFTVILLIGSGYSLMKGYLNDKEKTIIACVLVLQVLDNVAMVVLEETAPGSQLWLTWRDILHLVDIICCCAVLFPIVWSIRHLKQAAETDGKMHVNVQKLQLFRQFYIMVVCYIYFTRIIVYLVAATIPFNLQWIGTFFAELAALIFYVVTGYFFRPAVDNPYLAVHSDESEGQLEYGLRIEDDTDDTSSFGVGPTGTSSKSVGKKAASQAQVLEMARIA